MKTSEPDCLMTSNSNSPDPAAKSPSRARSRRVLILGNDDRVVLAIARSLGRQGLEVHLAWHSPHCLARRSRYIRQTFSLPVCNGPSAAWRDALCEHLDKYDYDLVIPCNESSVVPLQRHAESFRRYSNIYLLDHDHFRLTFDKPECCALAERLGVCMPRTRPIAPTDRAEDLVRDLQLPIVVKPHSTFNGQQQANLVRRANTVEELTGILGDSTPEEASLAQECFIGTGVGIELIARDGKILSAFQHRRLHESIEFGSSYRKSVSVNPELLEASAKLMGAIGYTGVAMVEFVFNYQTGRWVFLEINGRFWGSLPLAVAAGADFPYYLYQLRVEGRREFPASYRTDVYCRNLMLDFQGMRSRSRTDGHPRQVSWLTPLRDLAIVCSGHDHLDNLTCDDPVPGLVELVRVTGQFFRKLARKVPLRLPHWPDRRPLAANVPRA
ncbi:MAG: Low molecular weight protein-tyrosine-phosphatase wzb [Planctomycetota bacterium]